MCVASPVVLEALDLLRAFRGTACACLEGEVSVSGHLAAPNRLPDVGKSETNTQKPPNLPVHNVQVENDWENLHGW